MNEANPFQVPAWSRINREQRRRERFKKLVIAAIAASVLMLVGLLILNNKTELAARESQPAANPQPAPDTTEPATAPVSNPTASAVPSLPSMDYVVKTGDTLTGIAKAHRTTIKAIETANGLASDHILIGEKLRIPEP